MWLPMGNDKVTVLEGQRTGYSGKTPRKAQSKPKPKTQVTFCI